MSLKPSTKTKTTPWAPAEASIKNAMGTLDSASGTAQATLAQHAPALNAAIAQIQGNIANPPGYVTSGREMLDKTIQGDFVNSNPHTAGLADLIAKRAQGGYNASFGAAGRSHGGLASLLSAQGVGDALGNFYSGIYDQERGRQQQAIMAAPGYHQDEYTDIDALFPAVNNTAMMPLNAANAYGGGITQVTSPYNTQTQKSNPGLAGILGPAMMLGSAFLPGAGLAGLIGGAGGPMTSAASHAPRFLG